jgi:predicted GNAT family N-acyltransferase
MVSKIIKIKQHYWNYSYDEHIKWMNENINEDEHHLIILDSKNEAIAYLNLVKNTIIYNDVTEEVIGVGNVCVDKKYTSQGIGQLIMSVCNYYLNSYEKRSILLCKSQLVKFYEKSGWIKYEGEVYINNMKFQGELMSTNRIINPQVIIKRNF